MVVRWPNDIKGLGVWDSSGEEAEAGESLEVSKQDKHATFNNKLPYKLQSFEFLCEILPLLYLVILSDSFQIAMWRDRTNLYVLVAVVPFTSLDRY